MHDRHAVIRSVVCEAAGAKVVLGETVDVFILHSNVVISVWSSLCVFNTQGVEDLVSEKSNISWA